MNIRAIGLLAALVAVAASPAPAQDHRASSPLSQSFTRSPLGGTHQAPSLWYYGPSYSLYYDRAPPGATGYSYRPSHFFDPYYGYDYFDRYERGHRFGR